MWKTAVCAHIYTSWQRQSDFVFRPLRMRYSSGFLGYEIYLCFYNGKQLCAPWGERAKAQDVLFTSLLR